MTKENRRHMRLPIETRMFIELEAPGLSGKTASNMLACTAEQVSRGGFQAALDRELSPESIFQVVIESPQTSEPLHLWAEVVWCHPDPDKADSWRAGFKLINNQDSDIEQWISLLIELEG